MSGGTVRSNLSLGEVVGAARRRDMRIVITSYGRPTATLLNALSADSASVVSSLTSIWKKPASWSVRWVETRKFGVASLIWLAVVAIPN